MIYAFYYFIAISVFAIFITVLDKNRAIKHQWRISEQTLFTTSILGGSIAMYLTMNLIRHKTKHKRFYIGIPLIIGLQLLVLFLVFKETSII